LSLAPLFPKAIPSIRRARMIPPRPDLFFSRKVMPFFSTFSAYLYF
jgi:hypothetical protein